MGKDEPSFITEPLQLHGATQGVAAHVAVL
jgi:hypothetical protein